MGVPEMLTVLFCVVSVVCVGIVMCMVATGADSASALSILGFLLFFWACFAIGYLSYGSGFHDATEATHASATDAGTNCVPRVLP